MFHIEWFSISNVADLWYLKAGSIILNEISNGALKETNK